MITADMHSDHFSPELLCQCLPMCGSNGNNQEQQQQIYSVLQGDCLVSSTPALRQAVSGSGFIGVQSYTAKVSGGDSDSDTDSDRVSNGESDSSGIS